MGVPEFRDYPLSTAQLLVERLAVCTVTADFPRAETDRREAIGWLRVTADRMGYRLVPKDAPDA
jgi:hypothetical protein